MPKKLDRCVRKVAAKQKGKKKKVNHFAVCKAAMKKKRKTSFKSKSIYGTFQF